MLYDTHAHINFSAFKENYKQLIERSLASGVWINNVGTQKDTSAEAVKIAEEFGEGVFAIVGLHPIDTIEQHVDEEESHFKTREEVFDYDYYKKLVESPKVVGIGECGLDYYRIPEALDKSQVRAIQQPVFEQQIRLAKESNKGLAIHCRPSAGSTDAYDDILQILGAQGAPQRFEIHSYTGDWTTCQKFLALGAYVAFNGIITFDKTGRLAEVVKNCPLEKIVLETDAPYLAPVPFRGKKNEPAYVEYTARKVAELKGLSFEDVCQATTLNARKLYAV